MEAPTLIEKPHIEYRVKGSNNNLLMKADIINEDNSITEFKYNSCSHIETYDSITNPSHSFFIVSKTKELIKIYEDLGFDNIAPLETAFHIIQMCSLNKMNDIIISKTSHQEILIYRKKNDTFLNLLIDDEGDVAYVKMGSRLEDKKIEIITDEKVLNEITSYLQF